MINIIAAIDNNNLIGNNDKLPWSIPEEMSYFKKITKDSILIMGRITFESIKKNINDRHIIVVSHRKNPTNNNISWSNSLQSAIDFAKNLISHDKYKQIFICGGQDIYKQSIDFADRLYITRINKSYTGNKYFPEFDKQHFSLVSEKTTITKKNIKLNFYVYDKLNTENK